MTRTSRNTLFLLSAAAALSLLTACGGETESAAKPPVARPPVAAATAALTAEMRPEISESTGSIEPIARVGAATKIMGRIERIAVHESDAVRRGQVLVTLEKRDLEAGVETARAALAMAEAQRENAAAHHARIVELHGRGSATDKNLEDATAGFRVAEAGVAQAEAAVRAAEVTLGYATIRAPFDGVVSARLAEEGEMAAPGRPLLTLDRVDRVKVVVQVPEAQVVGLAVGDAVRVSVDALGRSLDARISRVLPAGDPGSRSYEVQAVLDNPRHELRAGMFARVIFEGPPRERIFVPHSAIVRRGQLEGIYVVGEDGIARMRWVRLGREQDGEVELLSGASAGERYVPAPPPGLVDGTPLAVR